jgi:diguanylate cyclase
VAVNVSPGQFRLSGLAGIVSEGLARTGLHAGRLKIEITEGVLMEDRERGLEVLSMLRELGVRIALDDFGSGYSSLGYPRKARFDKLKIDRSFLVRLGETDDAAIIVRTIVGLAHSLGLSVAAEGVETSQQLAIDRELLCDQVQGHLVGRPAQIEPAHPRNSAGGAVCPHQTRSISAAIPCPTPMHIVAIARFLP